jgi:hypothetical protein
LAAYATRVPLHNAGQSFSSTVGRRPDADRGQVIWPVGRYRLSGVFLAGRLKTRYLLRSSPCYRPIVNGSHRALTATTSCGKSLRSSGQAGGRTSESQRPLLSPPAALGLGLIVVPILDAQGLGDPVQAAIACTLGGWDLTTVPSGEGCGRLVGDCRLQGAQPRGVPAS